MLHAQQQFQNHVNTEIKAFVANLAKSITALHGRQIIVDTNRHRLFVNTETQTDAEDPQSLRESAEDDKDSKQAASLETTSLGSVARKLDEMGQKTEETLYNELAQKMSELQAYLYELDATSYKTSYSGFGGGSSNSGASMSSSGGGGAAIQKFKAEIRSVKGTMLNARTFTASPNRAAGVAR